MSNKGEHYIPSMFGGKNVFVNSTIFRHTTGPDGKEQTFATKGGRTVDITGLDLHKNVHNEFNIVGGRMDNVSIGATGATNLKQNYETFEKGATKQNFDISGGTFVQSSIGGKAEHTNKNSKISGGGSGPGVTAEMWDGNVNQNILLILKSGISLQDLASALRMGHKIKELSQALRSCSSDSVLQKMVKSILTNKPNAQ